MKPGAEADDAWRLVEDEFEVTARLFTRHLHHAELQRQKRLAKTRNQHAVDAIVNPSSEVSSTSAIPTKSSNQDSSSKLGDTRRHNEPNAADDDPWLRDPRLAGLMSHKNNKPALTKIDAVHSTSRAAYGYSKGQASPPKRRKYAPLSSPPTEDVFADEEELQRDDYDSDDLDGPSQRVISSFKSNELNSKHASTNKFTTTDGSSKTASRLKPMSNANEIPSKVKTEPSSKIAMYQSDDDDDEDGDEDDLFAPFRLRRGQRPVGGDRHEMNSSSKKALVQEVKRKKSLTADEIPTFLL